MVLIRLKYKPDSPEWINEKMIIVFYMAENKSSSEKKMETLAANK